MKYSMFIAATLALAALVQMPQTAQAQSKEVIASQNVQREVFALEGKVEAFQVNQAERMAALESLVNKLVDSNSKLAASLEEMKGNLKQSLTEQQSRIAEPVSTLRSSVDTLSESMTSLREQVGTLERRSKENEANMDEIKRGVRSLISSPPASAGIPNAEAAGSPDAAKDLYTNAMRDFSSGKDERAMEGLRQLVTTYPSSPDAPHATYLMGKLYDKAGQNDDAIQAFDRVLEQYPENPIKPDALFEKAEQLLKIGKKAEALKEFRSFLTRYPTDPNVTSVQARITELQRPAAPPVKPAAQKGKRGKQ